MGNCIFDSSEINHTQNNRSPHMDSEKSFVPNILHGCYQPHKQPDNLRRAFAKDKSRHLLSKLSEVDVVIGWNMSSKHRNQNACVFWSSLVGVESRWVTVTIWNDHPKNTRGSSIIYPVYRKEDVLCVSARPQPFVSILQSHLQGPSFAIVHVVSWPSQCQQ